LTRSDKASPCALTDALRAQQHEFSNQLHAVTGLLKLGQVEQALGYLTELHGGRRDLPSRCGPGSARR
jgi:sensor histidine kinase regulating citrate/malate metabolism